MSLMQLLAVGRSIGTIKNEPSPYKMTEDNLLPRFGAGKAEGTAEAPAVGLEAAEVLHNSVLKPSPEAGLETAVAEQDQEPLPAPLPAGKKENLEQSVNDAERVSGYVRKVASPRRGWSLLGNFFKARPKRARSAGLVQPELALDLVKPVCNDLNDVDLEIVTARKLPEPSAKDTLLSGVGRKREAGAGLWRRLRAGLIRSKTRQT